MKRIDHLVITAPTRAAGVAWLEAQLGVSLQTGGEHARMGTHNALLSLGEGVYLEVIAVDPAAPAPGRPRWFGLDVVAADAAPRLATWAARSDDIARDAALGGAAMGEVIAMSRGALDWRITVPADGQPGFGGVLPALIQWSGNTHPAAQLVDVGCRLKRLRGAHAELVALRALMASLGLDDSIEWQELSRGEAPWLSAEIETPTGTVVLGGQEQ
ncbi:VOC family protein [Denitromonas ohlonensis]|uniref:VOC family protein n=2 Tax=Denitromonas TaxID=139331 RepID=A0A557RRV5_9RHOO|nr:VOC family protein [Denitromonas ohlonensis]TVO67854.1 VOC family protein [Denitromonas ohlonensis]TVO78243.1 VOC family protein [Denitromonas ohlonensis]